MKFQLLMINPIVIKQNWKLEGTILKTDKKGSIDSKII